MSEKQQLGQFYTTNYTYILQNFNISFLRKKEIPIIIEPFTGKGDLINFLQYQVKKLLPRKINLLNYELYDIDPKFKNTIKRDTLIKPPVYKNKFVITNPPYLARNKSTNKSIYDKYKYKKK